MNIPPWQDRRRKWLHKFRDALRGVAWAVAEGSSFRVHLVMAPLVIICGLVFRVDRREWCILILCITLVLAAETFNSALETMGRAVDRNHNASLGKALDMAGGAVLICSIGAAITGLVVFLSRAANMLQ